MRYFETAQERIMVELFRLRKLKLLARIFSRVLVGKERENEESMAGKSIRWDKPFIVLAIGFSVALIVLLVEYIGVF